MYQNIQLEAFIPGTLITTTDLSSHNDDKCYLHMFYQLVIKCLALVDHYGVIGEPI